MYDIMMTVTKFSLVLIFPQIYTIMYTYGALYDYMALNTTKSGNLAHYVSTKNVVALYINY